MAEEGMEWGAGYLDFGFFLREATVETGLPRALGGVWGVWVGKGRGEEWNVESGIRSMEREGEGERSGEKREEEN